MKKLFSTIIITIFTFYYAYAQDKYFTRTGTLSFFSETPMENIEAVNNQVSSILDVQTGDLAVSAQMIGFEFEKALMQEHFNENYIESEKYPKTTFKGHILNYTGLPADDNEVAVEVDGELTIHGVTKVIKTAGQIIKSGEAIEVKATFPVAVNDFDIKIPKTVINNIAETVEVRVFLVLIPYNQ